MHYTFWRLFLHWPLMFSLLLIVHNQKKVLLIKWVSFFFELKNICLLFSTFWKWSYLQRYFDVDQRYETQCWNFVNLNVDIHNVVSTLIWHCPASRRHIILTKTLRPRWKVSWGFTNIVKRLHNFVKFLKLKTYIFSRRPLNCCFRKLSKRFWENNFGLNKIKKKTEKK